MEERLKAANRVASRAALRLLPIVTKAVLTEPWARTRNLTPVAFFGASSIPMFAAVSSINRDVDQAVADAANATFVDIMAADARNAAAWKARTVDPKFAHVFVADIYSYAVAARRPNVDMYGAADPIMKAANAANIWPLVRADLLGPEAGIWPGGMPEDMVKIWVAAKQAMRAHDPSWEVWILWYERVIDGRDWHQDAMAKVLETFTEEADWQGDPVVINGKFDEVLALYRAEDEQAVVDATPIGETVEFDPKQNLLVLRPRDQIDADDLSVILEEMAAARRIFDGSDGLSNAYQPLADELALLEDAETRYAKRPIHVMKTVTRVLRRLAHKAETGDCPTPEQDTKIKDFQLILEDVQIELAALNDDVRAWHNKTRPRVVADAVPLIVEGAQALTDASDPDLQGALEQVVDTLNGDAKDVEALEQANQRGAGLLVRSYRAAKPVLDETADTTKKVGVVVTGATATGGGLAWLASPAFREFVAAFLKGVT